MADEDDNQWAQSSTFQDVDEATSSDAFHGLIDYSDEGEHHQTKEIVETTSKPGEDGQGAVFVRDNLSSYFDLMFSFPYPVFPFNDMFCLLVQLFFIEFRRHKHFPIQGGPQSPGGRVLD